MVSKEKWQLENLIELYLNSFQRLITFATLINTGAILLIVNTLTSLNASKYIFSICKHSFTPLKFGLFSFVLALFCISYIVFTDFKDLALRVEKIILNQPPPSNSNVQINWKLGYSSIICMIAGMCFSLLPIFFVK